MKQHTKAYMNNAADFDKNSLGRDMGIDLSHGSEELQSPGMLQTPNQF